MERARHVRRAGLSLNLLLVFAPLAIGLEAAGSERHGLIFLSACLAIVPLAGWMGKATERLADRAGEGIGGLLNATFGNAAEMIIAIVALQAGKLEIVKASITGSIIGNILLVLGAAFLAGGLTRPTQTYNAITARAFALMLFVTAIALIVPAGFHALRSAAQPVNESALSLTIACILIAAYALSLVFSLRTHKDLFRGSAEAPPEPAAVATPLWRPLAVLVVATIGIAWLSEVLVGSVEPAAQAAGMSQVFVGVVIVAVIGNAAEHSSAILAAVRDRMDLAIAIALGSSAQIALFVAPVLLLLSYAIGPARLDLVFSRGQVLAILIACSSVAHATSDGRSNWFTGVLLLTLYTILGVVFYFTPA
jgi:Ca2+:H+ antiporter